jgi:hypothetical protein
MEKPTYEVPGLDYLGSFEEMTQGTTTGDHLDQAIPVGFPVNQIPGFIDNHLS